MALRRLALACLATALIAAGCGGDGAPNAGGATPSPTASSTTPPVGECPEVTDLHGISPDSGEFTQNVIVSFAQRIEDDTLYGDYYRIVFADFQVEPDETITTEAGERAIEIEIYARDHTMPVPGTYDFEGQQNIFFQPKLLEGGVAHFVSTLGEGGTLTLSVANDQEVCGGLDVSDGSTTIEGSFRASLVTE